jgi:DNA repair photolyase
MGLNISKGNMYEFVTHTWNTIKGECFHDCSYCYMKRWGKLKHVHFDVKELNTDLGEGNFIFVGSGCDMWADNIPDEWIFTTLCHCNKFDNSYLFQTKNPHNIRRILIPNSHVCVTLETNRHYPEIMRNSPTPKQRVEQMKLIRHPLYITIEPIMDFDLHEFLEILKECEPIQVNIGADSGNHKLPEPPLEKVLELITELGKFTTIHNKSNLGRLLKSGFVNA